MSRGTASPAASRRYFSLAEEDKRQDLVDERFRRGYIPLGVAHRPPLSPDLKESYEVSLDLPLDDPRVQAGYFLHGPNRWPARYPWLQASVEPYLAAMMKLGERLLRLFALSLGLDADFLVSLSQHPTMHLRLLHYPPQPPLSPDDQYGAPPHTDLGMLTILNQDPIGGLELQLRSGEWIAAPWVDDTFVVNVGDLFSVWTNDLYVSTPHRVVNRTGQERFSVPTFFSPDFETLVSFLPTCLEEGQAPRYEPILSGEYLKARLLAGYRIGKAS